MRRHLSGALFAAAACAVLAAPPGERWAPAYSSASIFNLGSGAAGDLAPNTLAVVFGENLASGVASRADLSPNLALLPTTLPGAGVTVRVNGILAAIEYASPDAVVFIVPPELLPGPASIVLTHNSLLGPAARVTLKEAAPSLLPLDAGYALARHAGSLEWCLDGSPLHPGGEVLLYGTGWGPALRRPVNLQPVSRPNQLKFRDGLRVFLDGVEVPAGLILYAGLTVGASGIYEMRLRLPEWAPPDPEIRLAIRDAFTQPGIRLRVAPIEAQPAEERLRSNQ